MIGFIVYWSKLIEKSHGLVRLDRYKIDFGMINFFTFAGMGDMAVSNCLGSNVFDILLGLSLPWFLKTGIAYAGTTVSMLITST